MDTTYITKKLQNKNKPKPVLYSKFLDIDTELLLKLQKIIEYCNSSHYLGIKDIRFASIWKFDNDTK